MLVFQERIGADPLGFQQVDVVAAWIPLFLFSLLFGSPMDYHVFLLSRIRERFDRTHDNSEAVAFGVRTTAGIIHRGGPSVRLLPRRFAVQFHDPFNCMPHGQSLVATSLP